MKRKSSQFVSTLHLNHYSNKKDFHFAASNFRKNETSPLHAHDFYEIFFVIKGKILHFYNGGQITLEKGGLQLIKPLDIHAFKGLKEGENIIYNFAFFENRFNQITKNINLVQNECFNPLVRLTYYQFETINEKIALFLAGRIGLQDCLTSILLDYFLYASKFKDKEPGKEKMIPSWLKKAIQQMERPDNLCLGLTQFVKLSGKSQEYLSRTMKECFNITATQWLNSHKLELSKSLLKTSDLSILEILYQVGFESESYFYRLFQKYFGKTPRQYRKETEIEQ